MRKIYRITFEIATDEPAGPMYMIQSMAQAIAIYHRKDPNWEAPGEFFHSTEITGKETKKVGGRRGGWDPDDPYWSKAARAERFNKAGAKEAK